MSVTWLLWPTFRNPDPRLGVVHKPRGLFLDTFDFPFVDFLGLCSNICQFLPSPYHVHMVYEWSLAGKLVKGNCSREKNRRGFVIISYNCCGRIICSETIDECTLPISLKNALFYSLKLVVTDLKNIFSLVWIMIELLKINVIFFS